MELTFAPLPSLLATAPGPYNPPVRPAITTFSAWHTALHGATAARSEIKIALPVTAQAAAAITAPAPLALKPQTAAKPEPAKPALQWERALKLFVPPQTTSQTQVDQMVWEDDFKAVDEWNAKPSKFEAFLARYDKNQTLTTLAFVALLLLWIY